jgi:uncharacterized protein (TIGR02646 family)
MRRLDRASVGEPACLANYQYGQHNWDDVEPGHRSQIRTQLELMQGRRCAYCEGSLDALGQHIEHFRRRHDFQHLTFAWSNLYWSCYQEDSCGRYKDHDAGAFNANDLIDPCIDDPDMFFRFRADGTISVRQGLQAAQQHRADETLRVFNLHAEWGRLRNMRKAVLAGYVAMVDGCEDFSVNDLNELFAEELTRAMTQPFFTAIRHVLTQL